MCYSHALNPGGFQFVSRAGMEWLECASLARAHGLLHAFSTRGAGRGDSRERELDLAWRPRGGARGAPEIRRALLRALGARGFSLAELDQIHSAECDQVIRRAKGQLEFRPGGLPPPRGSRRARARGDVLLTDEPGILLGVRTADCAPVLLADPRRRAVAAVHVGWRGALRRVAEIAAGEMGRLFGSDPADLWAAVGPSIRACCYEVGQEVVDAFSGAFRESDKFFRRRPEEGAEGRYLPQAFLSSDPPGHSRRSPGVAYLDLVAVIQRQLLKARLKPSRICISEYCTACRRDLFFSYRKEGDQAGRMIAVIGYRRPGPKAS